MANHVERLTSNDKSKTIDLPVSKQANYIPWIVALIFGVIWSVTYLVLGRMHGMWPMFNGEFPFMTAHLFTFQSAELSATLGGLFAFIDGAIVGLAGSWIVLLAGRITTDIGRKS